MLNKGYILITRECLQLSTPYCSTAAIGHFDRIRFSRGANLLPRISLFCFDSFVGARRWYGIQLLPRGLLRLALFLQIRLTGHRGTDALIKIKGRIINLMKSQLFLVLHDPSFILLCQDESFA